MIFWIMACYFGLVLGNFPSTSETALERLRLEQFRRFLGLANNFNRPKNSSEEKSQRRQDSSSFVEWRKILEKLLEIRCTNETMTILVHYKTSYSRLTAHIAKDVKNALFYTSTNNNWKNCTGKINDGLGYVNLTFNYKNCNTERTINRTNNSIKFSNRITIYFESSTTRSVHLKGVNETFDVACYAGFDLNKIIASLQMEIFDHQDSNEHLIFPISVPQGSQLFLHGSLQFPFNLDFDVEVFPLTCWLAQFPNFAKGASRFEFLTEGCPVVDARGHGLSRVYHYRRKPNLVGFSVNNTIWLGKNQLFYVACDVFPCVKNFTNGIVGLLKCPVSHYCAGPPLISHKLPEYLRNYSRFLVTSGPIGVFPPVRPTKTTEKPRTGEPRSTNVYQSNPCLSICNRSNFTTKNEENLSNNDQEVLYKMDTAVAVGFVSFLVGVITMAIIWASHFGISKLKKIRQKRTRTRMRHKPSENEFKFDEQSTVMLSIVLQNMVPPNSMLSTLL